MMAITAARLKRFVNLRSCSGFSTNLQFAIDATQAGFDVKELGAPVQNAEGSYVWTTMFGFLVEEFGRLRFDAFPVFKATAIDVDNLKRAAALESSPRLPLTGVLLEPGIRVNTEGKFPGDRSMNVALITEHPNDGWNDTDLDDYGTWADFRSGVTLTADGRGIVDFYIRARSPRGDSDLFGNITAHIVAGRLSYIEDYSSNPDPIWTREGGFR